MIRLLVILLALPALMWPASSRAARDGFEHSIESFSAVAPADPEDASEDLRSTPSSLWQDAEPDLEHEFDLGDELVRFHPPHPGVERPRRTPDPQAPHPERTTPPPEARV